MADATANEPPILEAIPDQTIAQGESKTIPITASDPNGDNVTLSVVVHRFELPEALADLVVDGYHTFTTANEDKTTSEIRRIQNDVRSQ